MFKIKVLFAILVTCVANFCAAQDFVPRLNFPYWAEKQWETYAKKEGLEISTRLNPFVWRGDFNGDGKPDLAIFVSRAATKKQGILLLFQAKTPLLLGAGKSFGNGGDDFSWIDYWHVEDRGSKHGNYRGNSAHLAADGLMVAKDASASALIYMRNGKPKWLQYGD
jgi:FG-GAP repeat